MTLPTDSAGVRVQAGTVRARDAFVEQRFGVEGRQRYRVAASPALRDLLSSRAEPRGGWVDFALFVEAVTLAEKLFGKSDHALAFEIGRFAASYDIGVWKRIVMGRVRPATLMSLAAGVWSHHYDRGRLISRPAGATGLFLSIVEFPTPHRAHCASIAGWMQGSLEMGPRRNARVDELSCRASGAATCDFRVGWDD